MTVAPGIEIKNAVQTAKAKILVFIYYAPGLKSVVPVFDKHIRKANKIRHFQKLFKMRGYVARAWTVYSIEDCFLLNQIVVEH